MQNAVLLYFAGNLTKWHIPTDFVVCNDHFIFGNTFLDFSHHKTTLRLTFNVDVLN